MKTLDGEEKEDTILDLLQSWVSNRHDNGILVSSLKGDISGVTRYLKYHKIHLDSSEIEYPSELNEEPYPLSLEEILLILNVASWDKKGLYLCLISTGA